ncbi:transaldolase [Pantoea sp. Mhis]|uniref:transaldolase n=1 Tax=Pantoea sp. Mhis TaxID=2576759 RepID=UPI00135C18AF|nr:transaldolase [Pantoea sp. Mhis]MXP56465.1 transaldolase [Pantoea sp. Mhis]
MDNKLTSLRQFTTVVADTADIKMIGSYHPQHATTNPSLILKIAQLSEYHKLIDEAIIWTRQYIGNKKINLELLSDKIAVNIGIQILKLIPGRISTEIDSRLSYNTQASIFKARNLMKLYNDAGIDNNRVLIKLAATWQGIRAAEQLEKEGINCNLTLLFSFAQARACAEAGVYLISPFVGRIYDWYKANNDDKKYNVDEDPGVLSLYKIYNYYKQYGYNTIVMGASFRNIDQIIALAGCDCLTISLPLLKQLSESKGIIKRKLHYNGEIKKRQEKMTESDFLWEHNQNPMAVTKLSEGICNFARDQEMLETILAKAI